MESHPNRAPFTWKGLSRPKESQATPPRKSGQTNFNANTKATETTRPSQTTDEKIKFLAVEFSDLSKNHQKPSPTWNLSFATLPLPISFLEEFYTETTL